MYLCDAGKNNEGKKVRKRKSREGKKDDKEGKNLDKFCHG